MFNWNTCFFPGGKILVAQEAGKTAYFFLTLWGKERIIALSNVVFFNIFFSNVIYIYLYLMFFKSYSWLFKLVMGTMLWLSVNICFEINILCPLLGFEPRLYILRPGRYTDWTTGIKWFLF